MTDDDKPSPRPWRVEPSESGYYLVRADGITTGKMWNEADAVLVREAVNAYAALRGENGRLKAELRREKIKSAFYIPPDGAISPFASPDS